MTLDINDNKVSASPSIQKNAKFESIEEMLRDWNMNTSILKNKVHELSEEITKLTRVNKRIRVWHCYSDWA
jgi:hypothetical protein